jgi:hypothetical protein
VYHLYNIDTGSFTVWCENKTDGIRSMATGLVVVPNGSLIFKTDTLKKPATVVVPLPDKLMNTPGTLYVPGTLLYRLTDGNRAVLVLDSVPWGTLSTIEFKRNAGDSATVLFRDVRITSSDTVYLDPFAAWAHSARVTLNTTSSGAAMSETVRNFPVLVRLSTGFDFAQTKKEGVDLRFARRDNTKLPFEIEEWDSAAASAAIWVGFDSIRANDNTQSFFMYWGNPDAKSAEQSGRVFDTANGFQGVWHLNESGLNDKIDATANSFTGTPVEMTGSSDAAGVIARAHDFDGSSTCITVLNARNGRLDVQTDSFYTVSAWVYSRTMQRNNRVIVSKGSAQYGLMVNEQNQWEFYGALKGYGVDTTTTSTATINVWTYLTGVRKGMKQYLYVNGVPADSTVAAAGTSASLSNNFYDLAIGRQSDDQSQWFDGMVDEVRVENEARSAGWIRLCNETQKTGQQSVTIQKIR